MLKIWCDFNSRTPDGFLLVLFYDGREIKEQIDALGLAKGAQVILYQDEDDLEVVATLDRRFIDVLKREDWIAIPGWSTVVRKANDGPRSDK